MTPPSHPPGPRDWLPFRLYREYSRDTLGFLTRLAREYGDVVHIGYCGRHFVLLSHPDAVEDVLVTQHRAFCKANVKIRFLMPQGLSSVEDEQHRQRRRLLQPPLLKEQVRTYGPLVAEQAARLSNGWQDGVTLDMNAEMNRLTQTVIGQMLFNTDVGAETDEVSRALAAVLEARRVLFTPRLGPLLRRLPLPGARRATAARERLQAMVRRLMDEQRRSGREDGGLLAVLLRRQMEPGDARLLTDEVIRDQLLNLFLAGHETSANGLTWCWHLLARHPQVQDRLHAELDRVLGGRMPTVEDIPLLPYTEMAFAEALRLYPPVWVILRTARNDCEVAGYPFRAGTTFLLSPYVVQRDGRWYGEPDRFDPEHMSDDAHRTRPRFAYFPFGGGPRQCIGEAFAWQEGILVLATLARRWRVLPVDGVMPVPDPRTTLRCQDGLRLRIERR